MKNTFVNSSLWEANQHLGHLAIDERLQNLGVHVAEDPLAVGDEELTALHRRGLEADESPRRRRLPFGHLLVQPDVVSPVIALILFITSSSK